MKWIFFAVTNSNFATQKVKQATQQIKMVALESFIFIFWFTAESARRNMLPTVTRDTWRRTTTPVLPRHSEPDTSLAGFLKRLFDVFWVFFVVGVGGIALFWGVYAFIHIVDDVNREYYEAYPFANKNVCSPFIGAPYPPHCIAVHETEYFNPNYYQGLARVPEPDCGFCACEHGTVYDKYFKHTWKEDSVYLANDWVEFGNDSFYIAKQFSFGSKPVLQNNAYWAFVGYGDRNMLLQKKVVTRANSRARVGTNGPPGTSISSFDECYTVDKPERNCMSSPTRTPGKVIAEVPNSITRLWIGGPRGCGSGPLGPPEPGFSEADSSSFLNETYAYKQNVGMGCSPGIPGPRGKEFLSETDFRRLSDPLEHWFSLQPSALVLKRNGEVEHLNVKDLEIYRLSRTIVRIRDNLYFDIDSGLRTLYYSPKAEYLIFNNTIYYNDDPKHGRKLGEPKQLSSSEVNVDNLNHYSRLPKIALEQEISKRHPTQLN